jgi:hypothetical protein
LRWVDFLAIYLSANSRPSRSDVLICSDLSANRTQTGEVLAKTSARLTGAEFVDFLAQIVESQPADREIHFIAGNLSEDKPRKFALLEASPTVRIQNRLDELQLLRSTS